MNYMKDIKLTEQERDVLLTILRIEAEDKTLSNTYHLIVNNIIGKLEGRDEL
jgi:hypothetical protein